MPEEQAALVEILTLALACLPLAKGRLCQIVDGHDEGGKEEGKRHFEKWADWEREWVGSVEQGPSWASWAS